MTFNLIIGIIGFAMGIIALLVALSATIDAKKDIMEKEEDE